MPSARFFSLFLVTSASLVAEQSAWLGYKWFSRKMIKKKTCAGRQSWAVGNSEFVMCNWQYELWLVTIYSVILHVLLSVNSGHAKYTSMAFFSKKNWWSWALGLHSPYQRNAYIYYISRIVWWNHGSDFFLSKGRMYFVYISRVGFIYTFWYSLSSTSSILE